MARVDRSDRKLRPPRTGCSDTLWGSASLPRPKGQDQYAPAIPEAVSRRAAPSRARPALARPTRPARKAWYQNLEEVTADGDFTATFRLKRPQPAIIALLPSGYAPVYRCHVLPARHAPASDRHRPIQIRRIQAERVHKVARNLDYWKPGRKPSVRATRSRGSAPDLAGAIAHAPSTRET